MSGFSVLGMTVEPAMVSLFILAFIIGMCVPFQYGVERLRGFGRAALSKLPYKPPEYGENDRERKERERPKWD